MKQAIALKWVEALRSGQYKQGDGMLRINDEDTGKTSFCCLGVLCNIHAQEHPRLAARETNPGSYMGYSSCLPREVMDWASFSDDMGTPAPPKNKELPDTPVHINGSDYESLADANDSGVSFARIATWIEKNYERL